jgi:peptide/nickel transport system substrate-binding protein
MLFEFAFPMRRKTSSVSAFDRRSFLQLGGTAAALAGTGGLTSLLAACGAGGSTSSPSSSAVPSALAAKSISTIALPFLADMGTVDPDIYYAGEGLQVTLSVYESLVTYAPVGADIPLTYQPPSKRIAPGLAESWEVSPDGLTYTFHLRSGVKFHDGTPMDAAAWQNCFARRAEVNGGPAYQVAPVASTEAPDPLTFVVKLRHPVDPFLDYMACPWGPKVISPTALKKHQKKKDLAQGWLVGHEAGTGPYMLVDYVPNSYYTLEAFPGWWGPAPPVKRVNVPIIPDIQTQELQFRAGQIDVMTKGLPIQDVVTFEQDPDYVVKFFALALSQSMFLNPTKGRIFSNEALRLALPSALNKQFLTTSVFKNTATAATQFFPAGCFPNGLVPADTPYDPSKLSQIVSGLSSKDVDLAYGADGGAPNRVMAELVQAELSAAGLNVTVRSIPTSLEYALYDTPDAQRPDILLDSYGGDTIHVDTMLRIIFRTNAQPLNWFDYSYPQGDKLMDLAQRDPSAAEAQALYAQSADIYRNAGILVNIANGADVIVSRAGITNFVHDPMALETVRLAELRRA